ncbi:lipoprotein [Paraburkholderia sp. PGU19]|uniref:BPSL1445 family SYLF domain-containing lipoprotein n=1 Tax=Paraburkholderia sp. PGU19 TaxID=2735434 RepID=UPI0015DA9AAC|nr:YSC84-related protein [Paraburkholderia sp. PGU19]BCF97212.1 lipoprotein [Paraburkholderia sp. PGU19]
MQRRNFMLKSTAALAFGTLALAGCTTTKSSGESAATDMSKRQSIDASVDGTMSRLYTTVQGSRELVSKARGILVFPSVLQVGFVVGGQYGEGSLRVGGGTVGYYSTISGSFGLQAGAQSKAIIFLFMTQDALDKFRSSDGWAVGADASVALVKMGANGTVDTTTATAPVQVFILTNSGLMADVSLAGTKVSKLKI